MSRDPRVAIIGAGPAGLSAALALSRAGIASDVYESSPHIGGLARSAGMWAHRVELGAHVISGGDARAVQLWTELAGPDPLPVPASRAVLRDGRLLPYPPTPLGVAAALGPRSIPVLFGAALARARRLIIPALPRAVDAESWLTAMYGAAAYRELMAPYLAKLFGRSGREIDASFVRMLDGSAAAARSWTPTFAYPRDGLSAVWSRAESAMAPLGRIHRSVRIDALSVMGGAIRGIRVNGEARHYDRVISTVPLRTLLGMLPDVPARVAAACGALRQRNIVLVHLLVSGGPVIPHAWVLLQDPGLTSGRVCDSRAWGGSAGADHVLTVECWCADDDATWSMESAALRDRISRELASAGLLDGGSVRDARVTRLRAALPIPHVGYQRSAGEVHGFLSGISGLSIAGRHSTFLVDSTIVAMTGGIEAASAAASGLDHRAMLPVSSTRDTAARSPS